MRPVKPQVEESLGRRLKERLPSSPLFSGHWDVSQPEYGLSTFRHVAEDKAPTYGAK